MFDIVEFESCGELLRGRLYLPQTDSIPLPVVVMTHGFSATINGMVADRYAEVFYKAGFAVLLYDHYSFGLSEGTPRRQINEWIQARGYCDAIDYLVTHPDIDPERIAIWGDSMSGGEVVIVGAVDNRVKAVIAQVPGFGDTVAPKDEDGQLYAAIKNMILETNLLSLSSTLSDPMPVVSFDQIGTPSILKPLTAYRWFIEHGGQYGTLWENQVQDLVIETPAEYYAELCAPYLDVPTLMLIAHNDEMRGANSDVAHHVYDRIPDKKELVELDGGHFGLLYYPSELFDAASRVQLEFLLNHL